MVTIEAKKSWMESHAVWQGLSAALGGALLTSLLAVNTLVAQSAASAKEMAGLSESVQGLTRVVGDLQNDVVRLQTRLEYIEKPLDKHRAR